MPRLGTGGGEGLAGRAAENRRFLAEGVHLAGLDFTAALFHGAGADRLENLPVARL